MLRLVRALPAAALSEGSSNSVPQRPAAPCRAGHARLRLHLQAQDAVRCGHHLHIRRPVREQNVRAKLCCVKSGTRLTASRYWGTSETLLPVYQSVDKAVAKHDDVDTVVNFASSRSVYQSTMELLEFPQIKCIAIIAEGVPERVSTVLQTEVINADPCSVPVRSSTSPRRRASPSSAPLPSVASSPARSRLATPVA
jgi:hypothetical protein